MAERTFNDIKEVRGEYLELLKGWLDENPRASTTIEFRNQPMQSPNEDRFEFEVWCYDYGKRKGIHLGPKDFDAMKYPAEIDTLIEDRKREDDYEEYLKLKRKFEGDTNEQTKKV